MKRFILLFLAALLLFAGCGASEEAPDAAVDIAPQATAPVVTPAPQSTPAGFVGYFICPDCLTEFDTEAEIDSHTCAQDAYRAESLSAMAQPLAVVANLFEVEGISYPAEDVVSDYALSYLFIYANLYLSDRAAEAELESEFFDRFITIEAGELSILLDAAFGERFRVEDLVLEDAASVLEKDGTYYIGASEVIPAAASYQGFGTLGEAETQEYLYNYSVTFLDEELSGTFSVELIHSTAYEGSLCLNGVYLG
ncbi:MAG: hypothetical protein IJC67_07370 [Clostridia bacterium]|nr:hypothetical protein [Clostridia bacterium]